ncbi:metallophosphoesterase family protein [Pontibacillus litoralis]|uniref:Metallophosphoesterase n=1 Tax=Pontibacillus litoralis JSM 072002 TaxID=1385512 RepID=A0A0A5HQF8_9BACI|nr:metallophosphoesterase family protein [Pontibacillus litoralis]KGX85862.1 metallophosphoesterase [Pontibacillus litoralis JSM 072002]
MELRLKENNPFKILQLTDLHIGSVPFDQYDSRTFQHIKEMTEMTNPDLVVITGDLIWSEGVEHPEKSFQALLDELNALHTPVAITYGNHDTEEGVTRSALREMEAGLHLLAPKKHEHIVEDRASYCLEVLDQQGEVAHILYMVDSGARDPLEIGTYEFVHPDQVTWFNEVSTYYASRENEWKQDALFLHIPLPEYKEAWAEGKVSGQKREPISSPMVNTGLFTSLLLNGNIAGVFCGHDHDNDFVAEYHGIQLCFGKVSGFQCYGELNRGARMIEFHPQEPMQTYIVEKKA